MPSQRRVRLVTLLLVLALLTLLYVSRSAHQTRTSDFYTKTQEALQNREHAAAAKQRDSDNVGSRLKAAEEAAKKSADKKGEKYLDSVDGSTGSEKSVAGRVKLEQSGDKKKVPGVANVGGRPRDREAARTREETEEEHEAEVELDALLKKSPIIIFSKSYCPHSAKAKRILLQRYKIVPPPFVVELDLHPLGPQLQRILGTTTGRKTVPNVLVMGKSIGGGDEVEELDRSRKVIDKLRAMGGSRIVEVGYRDDEAEEEDEGKAEVKRFRA